MTMKSMEDLADQDQGTPKLSKEELRAEFVKWVDTMRDLYGKDYGEDSESPLDGRSPPSW